MKTVYNYNHCAKKIYELYVSKVSKDRKQTQSISFLVGSLLNNGMSLDNISKEIHYSLEDIMTLVCITGNPTIFTVRVDGKEVNDTRLTINKAFKKTQTYSVKDYNDVAIGAYTEQAQADSLARNAIVKAITDKLFFLANFHDDNIYQETQTNIDIEYNQCEFKAKKAIYQTISGKPVPGFFIVSLSENGLEINATIGHIDIEVENANALSMLPVFRISPAII
jgi:hypothetical protein